MVVMGEGESPYFGALATVTTYYDTVGCVALLWD